MVFDSRKGRNIVKDSKGEEEEFDEIIFACDAVTAEQITASNTDYSSRFVRWVLHRVSYYRDITITHSDSDYMARHYQTDREERNNEEAMKEGREDETEERKDSGIHYMVRTDPMDAKLIEMSFNLHLYQPQFRDEKTGKVNIKDPIYQTIFLDSNTADRWTISEIDETKIHQRTWWLQFAHTWKHFAFFVPFERFIQGLHGWWFAGSWTLFNTHEIATVSGLAAAHRLGAPYPFSHDPLACKQFSMYLNVVHGC